MTAKAKPVSPEDALDPKNALVPTVVKVNEARVTRGFWPKIQRTAARIPFADQALAAWYADGRITLDEDISEGIEAAPGAIASLYRGENRGKKLIFVG